MARNAWLNWESNKKRNETKCINPRNQCDYVGSVFVTTVLNLICHFNLQAAIYKALKNFRRNLERGI